MEHSMLIEHSMMIEHSIMTLFGRHLNSLGENW